MEFGPDQSKAYEYGSWAHAYFLTTSEGEYYRNRFFKTEQLRMKLFFSSTLWMSSDGFLGPQIDEQLRILL